MRRGLLKGWEIKSLEEIAEINPRHPGDIDPSLPVSFIPMPAVSERSYRFQYTEERQLGEVKKGYTHFAEGDVLFAKITPCMENGKAAVATGLKNGLGCGSTEFHVLRPHAGIESKYLYYYLHQESFRKVAANHFTGTAGQLRVPVSFIKDSEIPLPPLPEQRRIVAKLEQLLGKVEICREQLAKIPLILKRFRQAVLGAACSGILTEDWRKRNGNYAQNGLHKAADVEPLIESPASWRWAPLQDICDPARSICYGVIKLGNLAGNGIPCLRTSDLKPLHLDTSNVKRINKKISDSYARTLLQGGEVLVSVRGTLGGVSVVPATLHGWNISREIAMVPVLHANAKYVAFWIASHASQNWLIGVAKGVAYTGINISDLKLLPIALPSTNEQTEIVWRVEELFSLADIIESHYLKAVAQFGKLTPSLLARAFRAELVQPQKTAKGAARRTAAV